MEVGNYEKKNVSPLNNELYKHAVRIIQRDDRNIGWSDVGILIDFIESNYNITPKEEVK